MSPRRNPDVTELERRRRLRALIRATEHTEEDVREQAAQALGRAASQHPRDKVRTRAIEALVHLFDAEESAEIRAATVQALGHFQEEAALRVIVDALHDSRWWVHKTAQDALVDRGVGIMPAMESLLESSEKDDRTGAIAVVLRLWRATRDDAPRALIHRIGAADLSAVLDALPELDEALPCIKNDDPIIGILAEVAAGTTDILVTTIMRCCVRGSYYDGYVIRILTFVLAKAGEPGAAAVLDAYFKVDYRHRECIADVLVAMGQPAVAALCRAYHEEGTGGRIVFPDADHFISAVYRREITGLREYRAEIVSLLDRVGWQPDSKEEQFAWARSVADACLIARDKRQVRLANSLATMGELATRQVWKMYRDAGSNRYRRGAIALLLDRIGWQPETAEEQAALARVYVDAFFRSNREERRTIDSKLAWIGEPAIAPLLEMFHAEETDHDQRQEIAQLFDRRNWHPGSEEEQAELHILLKRWQACENLGAVAIPALAAELDTSRLDDTKVVLKTIAHIGGGEALTALTAFVTDLEAALDQEKESVAKAKQDAKEAHEDYVSESKYDHNHSQMDRFERIADRDTATSHRLYELQRKTKQLRQLRSAAKRYCKRLAEE